MVGRVSQRGSKGQWRQTAADLGRTSPEPGRAMVRRRDVRRRARALRRAALAAVVAGALGAAEAAAETLTEAGSVLAGMATEVVEADVARTVDLAGDAPIATYVTAHMPDGKALQRTNLGYWVPWNGRVDELIDNHFTPSGDTLTFNILNEDISGQFFPITITLAYRTAAGLKFGVFQLSPQ